MSSEFPDVQLDVELLIREVEKHPCLYNKDDSHYVDPQYKRDAWEEISSILFKDVWDSYDIEERDAKCEAVVKRWRNLRACFARECKREKDPKWIYGVAYKRRKYIYYNEMSFLKSEYDTEETLTIDIDLSEKFEKENTTLIVKNKYGEPIPDPITVPKTNAKEKRKKKIDKIESSSNSEKNKSVKTTVTTNSVKDKTSNNSDHSYSSPDLVTPKTVSTNSVKDKTSNNSDHSYSSLDLVTTNITSNSDNISMNSVPRTSSNSVLLNVNETDSTSFAFSLVPMLNMLSVDDKVECQIKILSAILPFMKKCRNDGLTGDGGKRKTATSNRQTYGQKRREDIITVEIKSESESDGDL